MGFTIRELMALIGAQRFINTAVVNASFDNTIDFWDVCFYSETQSASAAPCTFSLNCDDDWGRDYSAAHEKMSLLSIDKNTITDSCC
ncbi:hypothetical protein B0H17DRAFT_1211515 [Mycena rosella]|uniref:Uncharacterized protein n=1 Tax=Mycena rosella TaxID=1033263 RepID=A0AAD7CXT8_MYCRO|nr:hypothetical protein B0H17DRAFT_1211515 [Mycena rosella]